MRCMWVQRDWLQISSGPTFSGTCCHGLAADHHQHPPRSWTLRWTSPRFSSHWSCNPLMMWHMTNDFNHFINAMNWHSAHHWCCELAFCTSSMLWIVTGPSSMLWTVTIVVCVFTNSVAHRTPLSVFVIDAMAQRRLLSELFTNDMAQRTPLSEHITNAMNSHLPSTTTHFLWKFEMTHNSATHHSALA